MLWATSSRIRKLGPRGSATINVGSSTFNAARSASARGSCLDSAGWCEGHVADPAKPERAERWARLISRVARGESFRFCPTAGHMDPMTQPTSLARPAGRTRGFRAIFEQHGTFVLRTLRRLGVPTADLHDLCQDTFVVRLRRSSVDSNLDLRHLRSHGPRVLAVDPRPARRNMRKP